ncbi:uncharacterized protein SPAPADRAFT_72461 [Spathaspora passalidarum NRRL Y-27907]|uniref:Initiation-specific alpha-1,6-mannosyltransferase n=1 Tax=Spathaspora passalidarum (strain NRRL Y-27907 / 11-Y1) TaxID=619300 RepID=G3ARA7_SPAPN|nr:uncharacterized protein SPAPADRAFT_72461 [Spathaspora passalidarum NRRL Y-27907]EGW31714.1 hypothetical protein SPAPADRAFT_72461 [Spathaspora passalidarum NRRL Y-27907]
MANKEEDPELTFTIEDDSVEAIPLQSLGESSMNSSIFVDSPLEYPKPGIFQTANKYFHYIFNILSYQSKLRKQLAHSIPYNRDTPLPKQIWQTWKVNLDDPNFPATFKNYSQTWTEKNPNYTHHILADQECDQLVAELYSGTPDVIHAYQIMPKPILKVDFFRYLILYAKGGVYSDMDTKAVKPIDHWASNLESKRFNSTIYSDDPKNPGLVVGIEADPEVDQYKYFARSLQFCQWTIQSKKGHPMLGELIARITETTLEREEMGLLEHKLDVMEWTGPGIFSDYVFDYLNSIFDASSAVARRKYDRIFDRTFFTHMEQPILIQDVLILPITSFSPDVGWMGAHESSDPMAYARHMFSGSWKVNSTAPT